MVSAALRMPLRVVLLLASAFYSAVIHEGMMRRRAASCALVMPKASCSARSQPRAGGFLVQSCHYLSNPIATIGCHGADGHEVRPRTGAGDGQCRAFGHSAANLQMFTRPDRPTRSGVGTMARQRPSGTMATRALRSTPGSISAGRSGPRPRAVRAPCERVRAWRRRAGRNRRGNAQ